MRVAAVRPALSPLPLEATVGLSPLCQGRVTAGPVAAIRLFAGSYQRKRARKSSSPGLSAASDSDRTLEVVE